MGNLHVVTPWGVVLIPAHCHFQPHVGSAGSDQYAFGGLSHFSLRPYGEKIIAAQNWRFTGQSKIPGKNFAIF